MFKMDVCVSHQCSDCCLKTEMLLSEDDVKRIRALGFQKDYFVFEKNGWLQLRNRKGSCVFLDEGKCSIYKHRPNGCRFYPLIFYEELDLPLLDIRCPYKSEFQTKDHASKALFDYIKRLNAEREKRLK